MEEKIGRPYGIIDLHCDTLTKWKYTETDELDTLNDPERMLSLDAIPKDVHWGQFYAIFVPDELRGQDAIDYYNYNRDNFYRQMEKFKDRISQTWTGHDLERAWKESKTAAFLTVENASALAGDMERIGLLREDGVRAIGLVWNGENELGSGHVTENGLSSFGKEAIKEMEDQGIIVDISHLNDEGFSDLIKLVKKPFIASHSNARSICSHKRNLTDDMIREIVSRDGLIGLNYFVKFIKDGGEVSGLDDLYRHIEHFLKLGAGKHLALGSDFDGAVIHDCLNSPQKASDLYAYLIGKGLKKEEAQGICYKNAQNFFEKNLG